MNTGPLTREHEYQHIQTCASCWNLLSCLFWKADWERSVFKCRFTFARSPFRTENQTAMLRAFNICNLQA
ncbi:hypothetical protein DPMN_180540 [Dreissena polymorpha]|uniref:Uncharacterized protein n=1 Tax=Dreissena polymorpha TaxID=45954 RepID=A0A9D4IKJ9_DREPO|nr:hypothetical protein DPMN_180540 [Dreissena polymorpha]